jgi:hypothetical protein
LKGEEQTKFDGKLKHEELTSFLTPFAAAKPASGNSGKSSGSSKPAEPEPVEVIEVKHIKSQEDLENFCYKKSTTCAIAFLDTSIAQVDDAGAAGMLQFLFHAVLDFLHDIMLTFFFGLVIQSMKDTCRL